jgi:glucan 1,4-alpha-glucosidase
MDYTPGIFQTKVSHYKPGNPNMVHTTLVKQLALYVTMSSPVQMAADLIENYEQHLDAFQFIEDVAVDWDDTKILEAEPGDYITEARKAKGKDEWYLGAITDENTRTAVAPLNFLEAGKNYVATLYLDGDKAHWNDNPMEYQIQKFIVNSKSILKLKLAAGGGAAVSLKLASDNDAKKLKKYIVK